ncbi:MAG: sodium:proton antiporter, partial [Leptolyngbya sp. SIO4C5]|nr:sodium:proton antiporter [Leptolyngbya sp. SIO4C5]
AVLTVLALMVIVRPLNIALCTWNSGLNLRQKVFLSWVAPRGIVSASVASLFAILLTERGINGGDAIKALVFLTILMTVLVQGVTAGWFARLLRITSTQAQGAVLVGCNSLSLLVARLFRDYGESVVLIDTDIEACERARQAGFTVFSSSALDADVLEEAGLDSAGTFAAMTNNGEVNAVVALRAMEEFQPPRVMAVFPSINKAQEDNGATAKIKHALVSELPIKAWNTYLKDGAVKLGETLLRQEGFLFQQAHLKALVRSGELVPLLIIREEKLRLVAASDDWQPGDRIIYLLHDPKPKLLKRLSGGISQELTIERLPAVEEVPMPQPTVEPPPPPPPGESAETASNNGTGRQPATKPQPESAPGSI